MFWDESLGMETYLSIRRVSTVHRVVHTEPLGPTSLAVEDELDVPIEVLVTLKGLRAGFPLGVAEREECGAKIGVVRHDFVLPILTYLESWWIRRHLR